MLDPANHNQSPYTQGYRDGFADGKSSARTADKLRAAEMAEALREILKWSGTHGLPVALSVRATAALAKAGL